MLLCDDVLVDEIMYFNGFFICMRSDWSKLESGTSKNFYLFIYLLKYFLHCIRLCFLLIKCKM